MATLKNIVFLTASLLIIGVFQNCSSSGEFTRTQEVTESKHLDGTVYESVTIFENEALPDVNGCYEWRQVAELQSHPVQYVYNLVKKEDCDQNNGSSLDENNENLPKANSCYRREAIAELQSEPVQYVYGFVKKRNCLAGDTLTIIEGEELPEIGQCLEWIAVAELPSSPVRYVYRVAIKKSCGAGTGPGIQTPPPAITPPPAVVPPQNSGVACYKYEVIAELQSFPVQYVYGLVNKRDCQLGDRIVLKESVAVPPAPGGFKWIAVAQLQSFPVLIVYELVSI